MKVLSYIRIDLLQTLLRMLPFPCRTGLKRIGNPGRDSPVLLTCNFRLTVDRVKRALKGLDAWLLVTGSRGVNVWCAAMGGLFSNADVLSVLETTGIGDLVDHREVILPQLAAAGIEGSVIRRKAGWCVVWGPVYARDLPAFLRAGMEKTRQMRTVRFPWPQRLEMAVAWAFPVSVLALPLLLFWRRAVLPLMGLVWALSLLLFLSFPLYRKRLRTEERNVGFVFFDFGRWGVPLVLWGLFMAALFACALLGREFSWAVVFRWGFASLVIVLILGLDLKGSTPLFKSGLHGDRLLGIVLDAERCKGDGLCEDVCPRDVFGIDLEKRIAVLKRAAECVQCGACVVQCPADALSFRSPEGATMTPETVRHFKLDLRGRRGA